MRKILTHEKLIALFAQFDIEGRKQLTKSDIKRALCKFNGKDPSWEELDEIMEKHDDSGDGIIQFEEFRKMMLEDSDASHSE